MSTLRFTILVLPGSSIMCVASTVDPLRAANRIVGRRVFEWSFVSADGRPPATTAGLPIAVDGPFDARGGADVIAVIGGFGSRLQASAGLISGLSRAARNGRAIGGIEAGTGDRTQPEDPAGRETVGQAGQRKEQGAGDKARLDGVGERTQVAEGDLPGPHQVVRRAVGGEPEGRPEQLGDDDGHDG